jgi:hypothetical protein
MLGGQTSQLGRWATESGHNAAAVRELPLSPFVVSRDLFSELGPANIVLSRTADIPGPTLQPDFGALLANIRPHLTERVCRVPCLAAADVDLELVHFAENHFVREPVMPSPQFGLTQERRQVPSSSERERAMSGQTFRATGAGGTAAMQPPLVSVIWMLVNAEQTRAARLLLKQLPDDGRFRLARALLRPPSTSTAPRVDLERGTEYQWLRDHSNEYRGQWVALSHAGLVAAAQTLRELRQHLRGIALETSPLVHFIE